MSLVETLTVPFQDGHTWVRLANPKHPKEGALPLIVLHGGPGMAHNYVRNIDGLVSTGRRVIHYDQFGCGNSSHRPGAPIDFWTTQLFVEEFFNVIQSLGIQTYHLLGQSWGGMLGAEIAIKQPRGMASLSICNSPASMGLWVQAAERLRRDLPPDVAATLTLHESNNTTDHPDYIAATKVFNQHYVCRLAEEPAGLRESSEQMEAEPTVYHTMNGPNEFYITGSNRDWSIIDKLDRIICPTFVVAGEHDEAAPETWAPFIDGIRNVRSHVFPGASHCCHLEQPAEFQNEIARFIAEFDR